MCMGTLANKTMGMLGSVADPTGKMGIKDKMGEWGDKSQQKFSKLGKEMGFGIDMPTPPPSYATPREETISALQRRR
jgi:hypothetical protein